MPFYTNAFPKQTGYVPRLSASTASGDSGKTDAAAQQAAENNQAGSPTSPTSPTGRRKSSAGADMFSGLSNHKRGSIGHEARKSSFDEMKPGSQGVLAGMWNNFTKGQQK